MSLLVEKKLKIYPPVPKGEIDLAVRAASEGVEDPAEAARLGREAVERLTTPIVIVVRTATLADSYRRNKAIRRAVEWLRGEVGEVEDGEEQVLANLPEEASSGFMALRLAADVIGGTVFDRCENFEVPVEVEDWLNMPDYLMSPVIEAVWELNPHWSVDYSVSKND